jgi:hypothetical protein
MRTFARQISVIALLTILLAPGLLQARTAPVRHDTRIARASVSRSIPEAGSFSAVWNLLTIWAKTGVGLDPSGSPGPGVTSSPNTSTNDSDTGIGLDPSGKP